MKRSGGHLVAGTAVIRPISARQPSTSIQYHEDKADTKGEMPISQNAVDCRIAALGKVHLWVCRSG